MTKVAAAVDAGVDQIIKALMEAEARREDAARDGEAPAKSNCSGRSMALPIWRQLTRSRLRKDRQAGKPGEGRVDEDNSPGRRAARWGRDRSRRRPGCDTGLRPGTGALAGRPCRRSSPRAKRAMEGAAGCADRLVTAPGSAAASNRGAMRRIQCPRTACFLSPNRSISLLFAPATGRAARLHLYLV